ncbi:MAG: DNA modification methylase [Acidobacteria bacterium]|nr:MAG: DNA modification methylase [Acidobacteriota bacterium]
MEQFAAALNAVCPYYTMFPLEFPVGVLIRRSRPKEWVLDPFCGRGTTIFAGRLLGLGSIGLDSNPLAAALADAKLRSVSPRQVIATAQYLLHAHPEAHDVPNGAFWRHAYHPATLRNICRIREGLLDSCDTDARIVLRAILLGALHGPVPKHGTSYLSNQCPRTFAPKPRYALQFWKALGLRAPKVDLLNIVRSRANRYLRQQSPPTPGFVRVADSRSPKAYENLPRISHVVTSPPYYGMRTYRQDQWLRTWFLGGPATVDYQASTTDLAHSSPEAFVRQLSDVWRNVRKACRRDAHLVVRWRFPAGWRCRSCAAPSPRRGPYCTPSDSLRRRSESEFARSRVEHTLA